MDGGNLWLSRSRIRAGVNGRHSGRVRLYGWRVGDDLVEPRQVRLPVIEDLSTPLAVGHGHVFLDQRPQSDFVVRSNDLAILHDELEVYELRVYLAGEVAKL